MISSPPLAAWTPQRILAKVGTAGSPSTTELSEVREILRMIPVSELVAVEATRREIIMGTVQLVYWPFPCDLKSLECDTRPCFLECRERYVCACTMALLCSIRSFGREKMICTLCSSFPIAKYSANTTTSVSAAMDLFKRFQSLELNISSRSTMDR